MSPVQQLTDMGVAIIPPVAGRSVQRTVSGSVGSVVLDSCVSKGIRRILCRFRRMCMMIVVMIDSHQG